MVRVSATRANRRRYREKCKNGICANCSNKSVIGVLCLKHYNNKQLYRKYKKAYKHV